MEGLAIVYRYHAEGNVHKGGYDGRPGSGSSMART
jgi:hypothetical protein